MSRSYRKTPMAGIASWNGIKWYKRYWNSRQRRRWKNEAPAASGKHQGSI